MRRQEAGVLLFAALAVAGMVAMAIMTDEKETRPKTPEERCIEKGGVPIMNWNDSYLKDCKGI